MQDIRSNYAPTAAHPVCYVGPLLCIGTVDMHSLIIEVSAAEIVKPYVVKKQRAG